MTNIDKGSGLQKISGSRSATLKTITMIFKVIINDTNDQNYSDFFDDLDHKWFNFLNENYDIDNDKSNKSTNNTSGIRNQ